MIRTKGSSKGCIRCIARKIKCDESTPYCKRCLQTGYTCLGYKRQHCKFINRFASGPENAGLSPDTLVKTHTQPFAVYGQSHALVSEICCSPYDIGVSASMRIQLVSSFLDIYIPTNGDLVCGEWPNLWPSMLGQSEGLDAAVYGYCAAFLGSTTKDQSLMHQSQALYGRGIRYLLNNTRQGARIKDEAVLVAVLLSKIDMFNPMSGMGWASHMLGSIELLRLRGPPTEDKTMNAGLWQLLRFTAIATAISSRKSLFLALPGWNGIHLPGTTHPLVNELLDIAVHLPGLLEEFDWLVKFVSQSLCLPYPNSPTKYGVHLRRKCSWVGIKLQQWYAKLQSTIMGPLFWPDVADVTLKAPFNTSLNFPTLHIGQLHVFYWAYQIILHRTAIVLRQLAKDSLRVPHTLSNAEHEAVGDYCASQICCSLPFFLRKDIGGVAPQALMWPLAVAMQFYSDRTIVDAAATQRNSWCDETSELLSEQGYSLCKNFLLLEERN